MSAFAKDKGRGRGWREALGKRRFMGAEAGGGSE